MNDLTFIFPLRIDSNERLENIKTNINYLCNIFDNPNILVNEDGTNLLDDPRITKINSNLHYNFSRAKIVNNAVRNSNTEIIGIFDADVFFSKDDYEESYNRIKWNEYDFVFGYNGKFWNYRRDFINYLNCNRIEKGNEFLEYRLELMNHNEIGALSGSLFCTKEMFFKVGGQNENMISWGYEDNEFYERILKLEKTLYRTSGIAYHIDHPRGIDSSWNNPYINKNQEEYYRIQKMNKQELINEINSWLWK